ncbi:MAG: hypothetical protein ACI959_001288 [Limisphaerales bacterium]|jgi:hypothetical protein
MAMFKVPKHRRFEFKYRFHDPKKEERENRDFMIREEAGREAAKKDAEIAESNAQRDGIIINKSVNEEDERRLRFQPIHEKRDYARKANMRVLIIALVLCVLAFFAIYFQLI